MRPTADRGLEDALAISRIIFSASDGFFAFFTVIIPA